MAERGCRWPRKLGSFWGVLRRRMSDFKGSERMEFRWATS